jgi:hypothetical protein
MTNHFTVASLGRPSYVADMTSPQIRPAGITTNIPETAAQALTWGPRPETPPEQKKYRQSAIHEPGRIVKHYGLADDVHPVPKDGFGVRSDKEHSSVAQQLKGYPDTEIGRWQLEQAESIYAR